MKPVSEADYSAFMAGLADGREGLPWVLHVPNPRLYTVGYADGRANFKERVKREAARRLTAARTEQNLRNFRAMYYSQYGHLVSGRWRT